jgi:hypothetical protein
LLGSILSVGGDALKFVNNFILHYMWRAPYYDKIFTENWASIVFSRHDLTLCKVSPVLSFTCVCVCVFFHCHVAGKKVSCNSLGSERALDRGITRTQCPCEVATKVDSELW